jgi:hypothetical protein
MLDFLKKHKLNFCLVVFVCLQGTLNAQFKDVKTGLVLDHIFILAPANDTTARTFQAQGMTLAKKWRTPHPGQGTTGDFFFFFNFYLEILTLTDSAEARRNIPNFGSKYPSRASGDGVRFGLGFRQEPPDSSKIGFPVKNYRSKWMEGLSLHMANSNADPREPIVFVEPPEFANQEFATAADLDAAAKYNPDAKTYRLHPTGIERLTFVKLTVPKKKKQYSQTLKTLRGVQNLQIVPGKKQLLELTFDNGKQGKTLDFREASGLQIHY